MPMIKTEQLREAIRLSIASSYVRDDSVSLMIIARPESGKTRTMFEFSVNDGVSMMSDITYQGLISALGKVRSGQLKTILIPDMLKVFGRKLDTAKNFITLLNEFIEEGIMNVQTFQNQIHFEKPVRGNIIAAVTSTDFFSQVKYWGATGFLSRIVPFSYSYSIEDVNAIFKAIMTGESIIEFQKIKLRKARKIGITLAMAERLRAEVTCHVIAKLSDIIGDEMYGFRLQRNLQTLAKASAWLERRNAVTCHDVDKIVRMANWMNYEMGHIE
jgi:hypothetical protein